MYCPSVPKLEQHKHFVLVAGSREPGEDCEPQQVIANRGSQGSVLEGAHRGIGQELMGGIVKTCIRQTLGPTTNTEPGLRIGGKSSRYPLSQGQG